MAFQTRSLDEISRGVRGALRQYLPGTDASLKQNVLTVIAKVVALFAHEYELRLKWIFDQLFLSTATSERIVRMHAAEYGLFQKPAAPASGLIEGAGQAHMVYPAGVRFSAGGTTYVTTAPFTANALGAFDAAVTAETSGLATNRDEGAVLLLADPGLYPTLGQEVTVSEGGLGGGADIESMDALRVRALKRKASPAQGGALADYERWSLEVSGVVNVWAALFANGVGRVGAWVLFEGRENGIPTAADLAAVDAHIADKRLVRAGFTAAAPMPVAVDLTIALSPDTAAQRKAVTDSLKAFFDATRRDTRIRPGLPGDPFTLPLAWISEVISTTAGENRHRLIAPASEPVFDPGELPVFGAITWA